MLNHVVGMFLFISLLIFEYSSFRMTYTKHRSTAETLSILDSLNLDTVRSSRQEVIKKFGWDDNFDYVQGRLPKYKKMMMIVWQIFEEPRSSTIAKVVTVISIFFILVSILSFVLQTLSMFRITEIDFVDVYVNKTATDRTPTLNRQQVHPTFEIVEWICMFSLIHSSFILHFF
jgi:potassium voltage-gated channel Shaw-related subfamily C protein 1